MVGRGNSGLLADPVPARGKKGRGPTSRQTSERGGGVRGAADTSRSVAESHPVRETRPFRVRAYDLTGSRRPPGGETVSRPLGRIFHHDSRSVHWAHGVLPKSSIRSVRWERQVPHFDQKNVGSCTGNAAAGLLVTDSLGRTGVTTVTITEENAAKTQGVFSPGTHPVDEDFALRCYELNTRLDSISGTYPPNDTGSSGLAAAKTLQTLGLCDVYTHGFTMGALNSALQRGPVMAGTIWLQSMFTPDANGVLTVDPSDKIRGGHEYVICELDLERGLYGLDNSWGQSWAINGQAYVPVDRMAWLLSQSGDVTVPHLLGTDAPTPVPTPVPVDSVDSDMASAMRKWMAAKNL